MPSPTARPDLPLAAAPGPLLDLVRSAAADRDLWAPAVERNVLEGRFDPSDDVRLPDTACDLRVSVVSSEGYASPLAAAALRDVGVPRATDLAGGVRAWARAGLPLVPGGPPVGTRTRTDSPRPAAPPAAVLPQQEERTQP